MLRDVKIQQCSLKRPRARRAWLSACDFAAAARSLPLVLALALCVLALTACDEAVCTDKLLARLWDDCAITIGHSPSMCRGNTDVTDDPEGDEREMDSVRRLFCEIEDPHPDVDCLLTAACDDIMSGKCLRSTGGPKASADCIDACLVALEACDAMCHPAKEWDACVDCTAECAKQRKSCTGACPRT